MRRRDETDAAHKRYDETGDSMGTYFAGAADAYDHALAYLDHLAAIAPAAEQQEGGEG